MKAEMAETEMTSNRYWLLGSGDRCSASQEEELHA